MYLPKDDVHTAMILAKFKVKICSLAEEARIIRKISRRYGGKWENVRRCLNYHNTLKVRQESRGTQLAYAFLRGKPYKVVENRSCGVPEEILAIAKRTIKTLAGKDVLQEILDDWVLGIERRGPQAAFNPLGAGSTPAIP